MKKFIPSYYGIENLKTYFLKFHLNFCVVKNKEKDKKGEKSRTRLFVANINLSFAGKKFDSHAKPHARTIRSGRRTVAEAVASRWTFELVSKHEQMLALSGPIYQPVDPFRGALSASELTFE